MDLKSFQIDEESSFVLDFLILTKNGIYLLGSNYFKENI